MLKNYFFTKYSPFIFLNFHNASITKKKKKVKIKLQNKL